MNNESMKINGITFAPSAPGQAAGRCNEMAVQKDGTGGWNVKGAAKGKMPHTRRGARNRLKILIWLLFMINGVFLNDWDDHHDQAGHHHGYNGCL
jgi:hypothetical protein